jgi:hypothetical protein
MLRRCDQSGSCIIYHCYAAFLPYSGRLDRFGNAKKKQRVIAKLLSASAGE